MTIERKFNHMKKLIILFCLSILFVHNSKSQYETVVFYDGDNKIVSESEAIKQIKVTKAGSSQFKVTTYQKKKGSWSKTPEKQVAKILNDSTIRLETRSKESGLEIINRVYTYKDDYYQFVDKNKEGELQKSGFSKTLIPLHLEGELKYYRSADDIYRIETYSNNQMISNKNWLESGERYVDNYYFYVDELPEYPGGEKALRRMIAQNLRFPEVAQLNGIQGRVYITFIVNEEGKVTDTVIARGVHTALDNEALRVVNQMATWKPGKQNGKLVKVCYTIPINFVLN
jgi:TonB family protein